MKDAVHHRKYVQKKVIQSVRKNGENGSHSSSAVVTEVAGPMQSSKKK